MGSGCTTVGQARGPNCKGERGGGIGAQGGRPWRILLRMDIPLPVGRAPPQTGPLARFMPPVEQGAPRRARAILGEPHGILVDPFGASARTVIEAAQAGWP